MRTMNLRTAILLLIGLAGCSATRGAPFDQSLVGQDFYLCCTTRFNTGFNAVDANYAMYLQDRVYVAGPMLPAGTRVKITKVGAQGIAFQAENNPTTYTMKLVYGRKHMTPNEYFANILRPTNPLDSLRDAPVAITTAISEGRLAPGLTREQTILARGYPPAHRTPSLKGSEWIYYDTPGFVDHVVFAGDKIQSVTRGPAPQ